MPKRTPKLDPEAENYRHNEEHWDAYHRQPEIPEAERQYYFENKHTLLPEAMELAKQRIARLTAKAEAEEAEPPMHKLVRIRRQLAEAREELRQLGDEIVV